jgi:hypothetical protein
MVSKVKSEAVRSYAFCDMVLVGEFMARGLWR